MLPDLVAVFIHITEETEVWVSSVSFWAKVSVSCTSLGFPAHGLVDTHLLLVPGLALDRH